MKTIFPLSLFLCWAFYGNCQIAYPSPPTFNSLEPIHVGESSPSPSNLPKNQQKQVPQNHNQQLIQKIQEDQQKQQNKQTYFKERFSAYEKTAQTLVSCIETTKTFNLEELVFAIENTSLQGRLDRATFDNELLNIVALLKRYVKENKANWNDYDARQAALLHYFIQPFMFSDGSTHIPPSYDHKDPFGVEDAKQRFVSKLLQNGTGQCYSLPMLYKILADKIGVTARIALASNHSYILVQDGQGKWYNFETTHAGFVTDEWIIGGLDISHKSIQQNVYMKGLSEKEMLAYLLISLVQNHINELGYTEFVHKYASYASQADPNLLEALACLANYKTITLQKELYDKGVTPQTLPQYPQLLQKHEELMSLYKKIDDMGYKESDPSQYSKK